MLCSLNYFNQILILFPYGGYIYKHKNQNMEDTIKLKIKRFVELNLFQKPKGINRFIDIKTGLPRTQNVKSLNKTLEVYYISYDSIKDKINYGRNKVSVYNKNLKNYKVIIFPFGNNISITNI